MKNDKNLQFIKRCIADAGQAMLYRNFGEGNKQAIGIKTDFSIDENGLLYFPLNTQYEENITKDTFAVDLLFYKKGKTFYVTAQGFGEKNNTKNNKQLTVKMKQVEFVQTAPLKQTNYMANILAKGAKIMNLFM